MEALRILLDCLLFWLRKKTLVRECGVCFFLLHDQQWIKSKSFSSFLSLCEDAAEEVNCRKMVLQVFELDVATPHPGIVIEGPVASRETNGGWVTLRATRPLTADNHQWAVKILDHGEGNDGSGLMVGLLPKLTSSSIPSMGTKYVSELGGWCLSRAGESYGTWKCEKLPFHTGSVLEFDLDVQGRTLHVVSGRDRAVGHIPSLTDADELYPAFSMYYLSQKVMFV